MFSASIFLYQPPWGEGNKNTKLRYYTKRISIENVSFYVKIVLTYNSIEVPICLLGSPSTINRRSLPGVGYTVSFDMYNLSIDFYQFINLLFDELNCEDIESIQTMV